MNRRFLALLLTLAALTVSVLPASGEALSPLQQAENLLVTLVQSEITRTGADSLQSWAEGPLAQNAGQGSEWAILALAQLRGCGPLPACDLTAYRDSLTAFLAKDAAYGASTRQKYALCMLAAGGNATVAEVAETTPGQQGIMSWIYGLHLMNNGCLNSQLTPADAALQLLSMQMPDGGWALMGQTADVDVTAMVLQALAPHQQEPAVASAAEAAVSLLAARQQQDGGFVSMGQPNPESAAQVMIALCALGIDPLTDDRFLSHGATMLDSILAYQLPEGGYAHTLGGSYSTAATVQVLDALAAYIRFANGQPGLYLLDGTAPHISAGGETLPLAAEPADGITQSASPASSIGIIGGADGPTAILLTGISWKTIAITAIVALAAVWCLCLLIRRKGKLKNYLTTALITGALVALVLGLDIQSPQAYYGNSAPAGEITGAVTLEIRCDTLTRIASGEYIPADGVILPKTTFPLHPGDTVYDLLTAAVRQYRLHLDASGSDGMKYVSGLNHLYEQAYGELSGWLYFVNGESASCSCDQYALTDGDHLSWQYSLEMGQDLP